MTDYTIVPTPKGNMKVDENKYDLCISYSLTKGKNIASLIASKLMDRRISVTLASDTVFDAEETEKRIAESGCSIILLTADSMSEKELLFAFHANRAYNRKISEVFLVHAAETCYFPNPLPSVADFFSEKAVTLLQCYADKAIDEILVRLEREKKITEQQLLQNNQSADFVYANFMDNAGGQAITTDQFKKAIKSIEKSLTEDEIIEFSKELDQNNDGIVDLQEFSKFLFTNQKLGAAMKQTAEAQMRELLQEDFTTRLFLSHKRSTGQGIAGRLFEGLKTDYKVFLDSEAKFVLHNLQQIVENTEVLIFILSGGIHTSMWCLQELKSAVKSNKKIIVVKDLSYVPPDTVPVEWIGYEQYLKPPSEDLLIWMAEFNDSCLAALRKKIGPPDSAIKEAQQWIQNNPKFSLNSGRLALDRAAKNVISAIVWLNNGAKLSHALRAKNSCLSFQDFEQLTQAQKIELENCEFDDANFQQKEGFANLKELKLKNCKMTDKGVSALVATAPNLEGLDLSGSKEITNTSLEAIAQHLKNLKTLNLHGCQEIDNEALASVAKIRSLVTLHVSMCHKLNDDGMEPLLSLENLRILNLTGTFITDKTLHLLGHSQHPFDKIDFTCTGITDSGLASVKTAKWSAVTMEGCAKITDAAVKIFAERQKVVIHVMNHDSWPKVPQTAKELKQIYPHLPDGEYTLYHKGNPNKPYQVYCHNMQNSDNPVEYLTLKVQTKDANFSQYVKGGSAQGETVTTWFSKIRFNPLDDTVKTNDWTFSNSQGRVVQVYWNRLAHLEFICVAYATARDCVRVGKDLTGTPFKVASKFKPMGCRAAGTADFSSNEYVCLIHFSKLYSQVVAITGGGFPGRMCPEEDITVVDADGRKDGNNEGRNGGWVLKLEWIGY